MTTFVTSTPFFASPSSLQLIQEIDAFREHTRTFEAQSMQQLSQLSQQDASGIKAVEAQLKKATQNADQAFEGVAKQLKQRAILQDSAWAQSRQELERAVAEGISTFSQLQRRVQALSQTLIPIAQKIHAFAQQEVAEMERIARENQASVQSVQTQVAHFNQEMARLKHETQVLQQSMQSVSQQLQSLQHEENTLERDICHLERAIKELGKRNKHLLLTAIGVIGGIAGGYFLANCNMQQMLSASLSAASEGVATMKGGVRVGVQDDKNNKTSSHDRHMARQALQEPCARDKHLKEASLPPARKSKPKGSEQAHDNGYTLKEQVGTTHVDQRDLKQTLRARPPTSTMRTVNPVLGHLERMAEKDMGDSSNPHRDRAVNIVVGGGSLATLGVLTGGYVPRVVGGVSLASKLADHVLPPVEGYLQKHSYMENDHASATRCMENPYQCHPYYHALTLKMALEGVKSASDAIERALDTLAQPVKNALDRVGVTDKKIEKALDALDTVVN